MLPHTTSISLGASRDAFDRRCSAATPPARPAAPASASDGGEPSRRARFLGGMSRSIRAASSSSCVTSSSSPPSSPASGASRFGGSRSSCPVSAAAAARASGASRSVLSFTRSLPSRRSTRTTSYTLSAAAFRRFFTHWLQLSNSSPVSTSRTRWPSCSSCARWIVLLLSHLTTR